MKSLTPSLLILIIAFALSSCMEFENQELVYSHDVEKDELRVTLRYQGIFGNLGKGQNTKNGPDDIAAKDSLNQKQISQLESVLKEKWAFFFNNWIFEYSAKSFSDMMKSLMSFGQPEKDLIEALIKNVEVQNIGFYKDAKGRLCGAQTLKIQNFSKVLALANQVIKRQTIAHIPEMRKELAKGRVRNAASEEDIQLLEKRMGGPYPFR